MRHKEADPESSLIEAYKIKADRMSALFQNKLSVPNASLCDGEAFAYLGLANYADDQFELFPSTIQHTKERLFEKYTTSHILPKPLTRTRLREIFDEIFGYTMKDGVGSRAIHAAHMRLGEDGSDELQSHFAELLAYQHKLDPSLDLGKPGISIDYDKKVLSGIEGEELYKLDQPPKVIVEYGPGLVAAKRLTSEAQRAETTIFVDRNLYVSTFLKERALLEGMSHPRVIAIPESIETATNHLLPDFEQRADVVIASRVRPADHEDLIEGIGRGYQLLRPGGLYVMQDYVQTEFPSGKSFYPLVNEAVKFFGPPDKFAEFPFKTYGNHFPAFNAVFVKR